MKRIILGTGILGLGLTALIWPTAPVNGGKGGHGGGHAGGGHAPARVGSVHYAARPAPVRVAPVHVDPVRVAPGVRAGAVRAEHYAGAPARGGYRNPYSDEYFRHFRPGYRPFFLDGAQYYGYDVMPLGYQVVVLNGITYYLLDGVYYQPYIYEGQTVYVIVPMQ